VCVECVERGRCIIMCRCKSYQHHVVSNGHQSLVSGHVESNLQCIVIMGITDAMKSTCIIHYSSSV